MARDVMLLRRNASPFVKPLCHAPLSCFDPPSNHVDELTMATRRLMVFLKWPITGIIVEFVGFVGLFGFVPVSSWISEAGSIGCAS